MQESMVAALRDRRTQIRARWEDLLRVERASTPLANPDSLVHLFDWTLDEFFRSVQNLPSRRRALRAGEQDCPCGRNPLLAYFAAGEQSLRESLVLAQAAMKDLAPFARDTALADLNLALQYIARREIEAFCAVCQFRQRGEKVAVQSVPAVAS
jgi:hypothetical protein